MSEREAKIIQLFDETDSPTDKTAARVEQIIETAHHFGGPSGVEFVAMLDAKIAEWREEASATDDAEAYVAAKLEAVVAKHPALQVALGQRTMRASRYQNDAAVFFPELS